MELMDPTDEQRDLADLLDLPRRSRRFALPDVRFSWPKMRPLVRVPKVSQERRTDIFFLTGLAAFAGGCGWIYPPAWLIVGGAFLSAVAWLDQRGRAVEPQLQKQATVIERYGFDDDDDEVD